MNTKPENPFASDVAAYRQPMVTSIGIILGFLLAFLANWAIASDDTSALQTPADWAVAGTLLVSVALMATVLFRLLDNRTRPDPGTHYQATYRIYVAAIVVSFLGLGAALLV